MSYIGQNPATDGQLTSGDPGGFRSCVAYSFAYATDDATLGKFKPSGKTIRTWTHDASGGLELSQCEVAVETHSNAVEFTTTVLSRASFYAKLAGGFGMVLLGGYAAIASTKYSGQHGFTGNHGIYIPPDKHAMDPLADGRHPGTYRYHNELYPDWLLDLFAADLRLGVNGPKAGANHFEVSFVRIAKEARQPKYKVNVAAGIVGLYNVSGRTVVGNPKKHNVKVPFSTNVTAPRTYLKTNGKAVHLVRLVGSDLHGKYLSIKNPRVHLEER